MFSQFLGYATAVVGVCVLAVILHPGGVERLGPLVVAGIVVFSIYHVCRGLCD